MSLDNLKSEVAANLPSGVPNNIDAFKIRDSINKVADYFGGQQFGGNFEHSKLTVYALDDLVTKWNRLWKSKQDNNQNHVPPSDPNVTEDDWWIEQSKAVGVTIPEYNPGTFAVTQVAVEYNSLIYKLIVPEGELPFTSSNINTELAAGKWKIIGGSGANSKPDHFHVESDLDNIIGPFGYTGHIVVTRLEMYSGVSTISFEVAIDGAAPTFTPAANVTELNTWINGNVTGDDDTGTKWLITFITNASKKTGFDFFYTRP